MLSARGSRLFGWEGSFYFKLRILCFPRLKRCQRLTKKGKYSVKS